MKAFFKHLLGGCGRFELWRAMARRGVSVAEAAQEPKDLSLAVRRCTQCAAVGECGEWLASGKREGQERFCPNADYLERLAERRRA